MHTPDMRFWTAKEFRVRRNHDWGGAKAISAGNAPKPFYSRVAIGLAMACMAVPAFLSAADPNGHTLVHPFEGSTLV